MAQTFQQQQRDNPDPNPTLTNRPPPLPSSTQPVQTPATRESSKSINKSTAKPSFNTITAGNKLAHQTSASSDSTVISQTQTIPNRYQPSKIFISKCRAELESLLDSIKDSYHDEFKNLYNDELHADLHVQIGGNFEKRLHKCVISSRAFKLFSALKAFKLIEVPTEEDIIIREFQEKTEAEHKDPVELNILDLPEKPPESCVEEEKPELHCCLPEELISPELFLSFARRLYLDTDVLEEETKLTQKLIDWLKINKPELIKVSPQHIHSPNHRESFRTIQPDFEELSITRSPTMSLDQPSSRTEEVESAVEDETSQATSMREESLTGSLLTRTETFELITKSNLDSPRVSTPCKTDSTQADDERSDLGTEIDSSGTQASYAPTTRTGLKPKTFTTPVGLRTVRNTTGSPSVKSPAPKSSPREDPAKNKTATVTPTSRANLSKQPSGGSPAVTSKRSIITSNPSTGTTPDSQISSKSIANRTKVAAASGGGSTGKSKPPTLITRALPISLERSQSPGNVIKSSGRNFIAANKRLISQMEKKPVQGDQAVDESENEISDTNSFAFEPLTTDNLAAQLDKFTLVSYSKLADSLSRLFINGLLSDTIILVNDGKQINAHKCILATRSAYLADLMTKQSLPLTTSESVLSNNKQLLNIDLTEFSYAVVYFSIMHIYSGIVKVPDDLNLDELTKLAHLLHVNTLTQVCMHNLRMNYCHFFHKPCNVCCLGVLKTLPLAWRYDYSELYSKCLQWIGSHFASIFCLKEFSELKPHDLIEECYSATLSQLTPDNIIPKTIECQKLLKNLPRVKWTEPIICLVGRQLEDFCHYVADNYEKILQSESFLNLGKNCWECEVLEENLLAAMNHLKPDSGCKTLIQLHKIECSMESYCEDPRNVSDSFANLVSKMRKYCERYLLKEAAAVVHSSSWRHMNPSLQKRIKDQAIISTDFDEPTKQLASKPKLPSMSRVTSQQSKGDSSSGDDTRSPSNRSTPEARLKSPSTTYLPPPKNKTAAARHVKVLK